MKNLAAFISAICAMLFISGECMAAPDQFIGDTAIFGGSSLGQPNVLIILDNSGSMNDVIESGNPYDAGTTYALANSCERRACQSNAVYRCTSFGSRCTNWSQVVSNVSSVTTSCGGSNPRESLLTTGQWIGGQNSLTNTGACTTGGRTYALGNWINWGRQAGNLRPKIDVAQNVVTDLLASTTGVKFGVMIFNTNQGGRLLSYNGYTASVKDMDATFSGTTTNRQALVNAVNSVSGTTWTPLAETLYEAMRYYKGQPSQFNTGVTYASPILSTCQKNYVILVTDGMSTQDRDPVLRTICNNGDCDGDGFEPANDPAKMPYDLDGSDYLDDVAKYLYTSDMSNYTGVQNVATYTVGFGLGGADAGAVKLLQETAANGGGEAFLASNHAELADTLMQILTQIFKVNTAFSAPSVPISPENKTTSGSRLYVGTFKPVGGAGWLGNIKKFGVNSSGQYVDKDGNIAVNSDGGIKSTAVSFWGSSGSPDGSAVDKGGVGALLRSRTTARNIYTYTGTNTSLTASSNKFHTGNSAALTAISSTLTNDLINYVRGVDSYDDDGDGNATENRDWLLGDILHSRPLVVNYASYTFNPTNEADCTVNKSMIFVGANDGMLHAFRDCDGSEAWAFIPPDLLPNLRYLREETHTYFVDGSPVPYIYDANNNGTIDSGDKVIIMFGERRGGGKDTAPTGGSYYALDVTDPSNPEFMFRISNTLKQKGTTTTTTTDYSEMAETWSEPKMVKVKIGSVDKIVAFVGAGYDNLNEDSRYGATQTYPSVPDPDMGSGAVTSDGTSGPGSPKGRGIYAVEIASLSSAGVPSFAGGGDKVWGYTNANNANMVFSIPSEVAAIDADKNGYTDTIYVGDTGGNVWRLNVGGTATTGWSAAKIFSANSSSGATAGKKIFYKPSITGQTGYFVLYFGTGDREHPLNRNVVDRMYAVKDIGQTSAKVEIDLTDVTTDRLQATDATASEITGIMNDLDARTGWYVQLNLHSGEKVLAPTAVFNKVVYFSTNSPNIIGNSDPCQQTGNLGIARVYAMNYLTGEAAINYDTGNDGGTTNTRAQTSVEGQVLGRSDRERVAGTGIPSGVVAIIGEAGQARLLMGVGGTTTGTEGPAWTDPGKRPDKTILPIYWRQKVG